MNICVEFELGGEPVSSYYNTIGKFEKDDEDFALGAVCTVLQYRKQKAGRVFIRNLKIHYNGQLVFEKSEYCIPNYTPAL